MDAASQQRSAAPQSSVRLDSACQGCLLGSHSIPESVHGDITEMVSFAEFEMLLRERYPDRNQHDTRCDPDPSAHGERFQWATALLGTASP